MSDWPGAWRWESGPRVFADSNTGAFYIQLGKRRVAETVEVQAVVNIDYDADGRPVGVEVIL